MKNMGNICIHNIQNDISLNVTLNFTKSSYQVLLIRNIISLHLEKNIYRFMFDFLKMAQTKFPRF